MSEAEETQLTRIFDSDLHATAAKPLTLEDVKRALEARREPFVVAPFARLGDEEWKRWKEGRPTDCKDSKADPVDPW